MCLRCTCTFEIISQKTHVNTESKRAKVAAAQLLNIERVKLISFENIDFKFTVSCENTFIMVMDYVKISCWPKILSLMKKKLNLRKYSVLQWGYISMALSCMSQHLQKHLWTCLVFRVYTVVTQFLEHSAMKCTKMHNSINELQNARASQPVKSPLFLSGASFAPTEELLASASLTRLLPPLLCPWGRLCNTVPSSSFFQTTKTLSYFILFSFPSISVELLLCLILHMTWGRQEAEHIGRG